MQASDAAAASMPSEFATIGDDIYLHVPRADVAGREREGRDPDVIVIFGWMGAKLAHLHKYTASYSEIYPYAVQVLVRSRPGDFLSLATRRRVRFAPLFEALEALGCLSPENKKPTTASLAELGIQPIPNVKILTHVFSNGGAFNLCMLRRLCSTEQLSSHPSALVLDSTPGTDSITAAYRAFAAGARSPAQKALAALIVGVLWILTTFRRMLGEKKLGQQLRDTLHDPTLIPWSQGEKREPRLYLYGKEDNMVLWRDVESHALEEAASRRQRGEESIVMRVVFEKGTHVAHVRADPTKYWASVKHIWDEASMM